MSQAMLVFQFISWAHVDEKAQMCHRRIHLPMNASNAIWQCPAFKMFFLHSRQKYRLRNGSFLDRNCSMEAVSITAMSAQTKNGKAGTLYLTIAPTTGVTKPVRIRMLNEKVIATQKIGWVKALLWNRATQRTKSNRIIRFSIPESNINGERIFHGNGLNIAFKRATGDALNTLQKFGSNRGVSMVLPVLP